jgi:L-ascorbate metabolism protein UlaG (beta-lactamase superfamily)
MTFNRRRFFKYTAGALGSSAIGACGVMQMRTEQNKYYQGPVSDHFDGIRFFNPGGAEPKGLADLWKWRKSKKPKPWPDYVPLAQTVKPAKKVNDLKVTMVGHATMLLQTRGLNILTDPFWSDRASPVQFAGPKRVIKPGIHFKDLPPIDLILLSHCHYDHMDLDTLSRLKVAHDPLVITPLGNDTIIAKTGLQCSVLDWGQSVRFRDIEIHCTPCHHWGARGVRDRSMALWAGFLIEAPKDRILFIGDTGFDLGRPYHHLTKNFDKIRLAILPIGAYEPRWFMADQHQNPAEAVAGFQILQAQYAIGHHWGTIQLTDEDRIAPKLDLASALEAAQIDPTRFVALEPADTWSIPG